MVLVACMEHVPGVVLVITLAAGTIAAAAVIVDLVLADIGVLRSR